MKHYFIALFEATTFDGPEFNVVKDFIQIFFFREPRRFPIFLQTTRVATAPREGEMMIGTNGFIQTRPNQHNILIQLQISPGEMEPDSMREFADRVFDCEIAKLAAVYGEELFMNQLYRGPLLIEAGIAPFEFKVAEAMVEIVPDTFLSRLQQMDYHLSERPEDDQRLKLASRFYAKSMLLPRSEERFLLQWTILEIFPMKDQTHIKPIREWISNRLRLSSQEIEEKLQIGRLYGHRVDLVHYGRYLTSPDSYSVEDRVHGLATEAIRHLCGLDYAGGLDRFLNSA